MLLQRTPDFCRMLAKALAGLFLTVCLSASAQIKRPKLVVGIVVDQMRWDYLYRYNNRYAANGGFKRLLQEGFSCENTFINYTPSVTAPGHASIYTGSVPAVHGITGNAWIDRNTGKQVYCVEDTSVRTVGNTGNAGLMSPRNLLTTTICDELKLATNFRSKVIGISLKDRGSILPAGHSGDAAYWYDGRTGNWVTSTYYMAALPQWVQSFNSSKIVDSFYKKPWTTLYPINTYLQSTADAKPYENKALGGNTFPYDLKQYIGKNYWNVANTPYGNSLAASFAKAAIQAEGLGKDEVTDFLAVSFSTPDYVGHAYGPNSVEEEDIFLRLDAELGDLFRYLDNAVGKNQYTVFLSADHGAAHIPGFMRENKMPAGHFTDDLLLALNMHLKKSFGPDGLVVEFFNYQIFLNQQRIDSAQLNAAEVRRTTAAFLAKQPGISRAFDIDALTATTLPPRWQSMIAQGYFPKRCGDVQVILEPHWIEGYVNGGTTHGSPYAYDTHIPLLWYGWGIKPGKTNIEYNMTDIATTLAALLHIQQPSGSIGKVIAEITQPRPAIK